MFAMSIRTGIQSVYGETKNYIKHRSGFNRQNENSRRPGAPGREHYHRIALSDLSRKMGACNGPKSETENLTRRADLLRCANTLADPNPASLLEEAWLQLL
jgi:hypothetical protein